MLLGGSLHLAGCRGWTVAVQQFTAQQLFYGRDGSDTVVHELSWTTSTRLKQSPTNKYI